MIFGVLSSLLLWIRYEFRFIFSLYRVGDVTYFIVDYTPIPRVEYTDDSIDPVVENLTLSRRNLIQNAMTVAAHNFIKFSPYSVIIDEQHHKITLTCGPMQADMRDVAFYFGRKTGIKMTDCRLAHVDLGGGSDGKLLSLIYAVR